MHAHTEVIGQLSLYPMDPRDETQVVGFATSTRTHFTISQAFHLLWKFWFGAGDVTQCLEYSPSMFKAWVNLYKYPSVKFCFSQGHRK